MASKLPMRFRILHIISENAGTTESEIMDMLKEEYNNEGQYRLGVIKEHLASMRAVGLIENSAIELDENDNLKQQVQITEFGESRLNYIPKSWTPPI